MNYQFLPLILGEPKVRRITAAIKGHYAKTSAEIGLGLWEFRVNEADLNQENNLDVSLFGAGHFVDVTAKSKGKGYQGGVKRHNFSMQDATHGNSISHRAIGSTGQCQDPGRVFKGKKMAGQMGNEQVTEECLEVIRVDNDKNLLLVKGAIPGSKSGFVKVILSAKKDKVNNNISKQIQAQQDQQAAEAEVAEVAEVEKVEEKVVAKVEEKATEKTTETAAPEATETAPEAEKVETKEAEKVEKVEAKEAEIAPEAAADEAENTAPEATEKTTEIAPEAEKEVIETAPEAEKVETKEPEKVEKVEEKVETKEPENTTPADETEPKA
ncbi:MAG: 50S ribosomal protein L3 [Candidatus Thioglobus sp.]|nr:50S ribosomal protein L3 [Candidatus Thioglobus sp.]